MTDFTYLAAGTALTDRETGRALTVTAGTTGRYVAVVDAAGRAYFVKRGEFVVA